VDYVTGSVLDAAVLDAVVPGRGVVISALSPRGDMAGKVEGVLRDLVSRVDGTATRLAHIGGASSLLVEPGGPTHRDITKDHLPDEVRPEVETGLRVLDELRSTPQTVDWFYVSPPETFGSWVPAPETGSYRLGGDVLMRAEDGTSTISAADLALAVLDEIETPRHRRGRFTAAH
jgi:putative NADH-flavin reductase